MHTICKDFSFAAAHAIRGHTGGCENLHGHNYRVRVYLRARRLDGLGMVLDFADLKAIMQEVLGPFDHRVLNEVAPFDERNTTAELLAQYVHDEVSRRLAGGSGGPGSAAGRGEVAGEGGGAAGGGGSGEVGASGGTRGGSGGDRAAALRGAPLDAGGRIWVARVEVWENDTSCAAYEP
jgi:6-pyruvoyltetrahydropterin/6-carboxytetrahydropterin synthase